jgi:NADP-dependent 3-hydroxy acid dehydrogenase YdfG
MTTDIRASPHRKTPHPTPPLIPENNGPTKGSHHRRSSPTFLNTILTITGSAGLGLVIARRLTSQHNFIVAINYATNSSRAEEALKALPKGCVAIQADISKRDDCFKLVKEAHERLGGLDLIVANAGWSRPTPFNDIGMSQPLWCRG